MADINKVLKYAELMEAAADYVTEVKPRFITPDQIANFLRPMMQGEQVESFFALFFNADKTLITFEVISKGILDRSLVHPREVFRSAILNNAHSIIIAHNHPSGNPTPSSCDLTVTKTLAAAGKIIGIDVLDHIIVGQKTDIHPGYTSCREMCIL